VAALGLTVPMIAQGNHIELARKLAEGLAPTDGRFIPKFTIAHWFEDGYSLLIVFFGVSAENNADNLGRKSLHGR